MCCWCVPPIHDELRICKNGAILSTLTIPWEERACWTNYLTFANLSLGGNRRTRQRQTVVATLLHAHRSSPSFLCLAELPAAMSVLYPERPMGLQLVCSVSLQFPLLICSSWELFSSSCHGVITLCIQVIITNICMKCVIYNLLGCLVKRCIIPPSFTVLFPTVLVTHG